MRLGEHQIAAVIFDLDGTLVDSEPLCNQAFLNLLPELDESIVVLTDRYRGKKLTTIFEDIEQRLGRQLPHNFESIYRAEVAELFELHLQPPRVNLVPYSTRLG